MSPPRRPHMEFNDGDYAQAEKAEPEPPKQQKKARSRANPVIEAEAGVDGEASGDERSNVDNDYLDRFIVADNVKYNIIDHLSEFLSSFIVSVYYIFTIDYCILFMNSFFCTSNIY